MRGKTALGDDVVRYGECSTFTYPCDKGVAHSLNVALGELNVAIMALPEEARCKHNGPGDGRRRRRSPDFL
ncbi:hypothetical protein CFI11_14940 [Thalassococcus sp. S3]|nr:hypothetical protein CFI11_14940 [Thalassococcus sp. S3]